MFALLGCGKRAHEPAAAVDDAAVSTAAAPDAAAPRTRAQPEKSMGYRQALARGRKAGAARDYAAAMASFEAALVAVPGDARALSELGWVAFLAGELEHAERATEASIAAAVDPKLRAASLYNRGRIAEAGGDNPRAIEAYQSSLALRPNDTVQARLATLGGAVRKALAPVAAGGPYPDLATACAALPFFEPRWTCGAPVLEGPTRLEARGPLLEVRVIGEAAVTDAAGESFDSCRLALRTARGWFLSAATSCEAHAWARSKVRELAWAGADAAGGPVVAWTLEHATGDRGFDRDGARYQTWVTRVWRTFCGVSEAGVPACTPALLVSTREDGDYAHSDVVPYELEVALGAGGVLTVKPASARIDDGARPLLGRHVLTFR